jgi:predicted dinucleotide-binding enzyme
MKVGFIGAGKVSGTFGRHLLAAGHTVVVSNSRGPETLVDFVADLGPNAIAGTKQRLPNAKSSFLPHIGSV